MPPIVEALDVVVRRIDGERRIGRGIERHADGVAGQRRGARDVERIAAGEAGEATLSGSLSLARVTFETVSV